VGLCPDNTATDYVRGNVAGLMPSMLKLNRVTTGTSDFVYVVGFHATQTVGATPFAPIVSGEAGAYNNFTPIRFGTFTNTTDSTPNLYYSFRPVGYEINAQLFNPQLTMGGQLMCLYIPASDLQTDRDYNAEPLTDDEWNTMAIRTVFSLNEPNSIYHIRWFPADNSNSEFLAIDLESPITGDNYSTDDRYAPGAMLMKFVPYDANSSLSIYIEVIAVMEVTPRTIQVANVDLSPADGDTDMVDSARAAMKSTPNIFCTSARSTNIIYSGGVTSGSVAQTSIVENGIHPVRVPKNYVPSSYPNYSEIAKSTGNDKLLVQYPEYHKDIQNSIAKSGFFKRNL
jgi:hypothetical protein